METLKITLIASLIFLLSSSLWAQKNFRFDDYGEPPFKPEYFAMGIRIGGGVSSMRGLDGTTVPGLYRDILPYKTGSVGSLSYTMTGQLMFHNQLLLQLNFSMSTIGTALKDDFDRRTITGELYQTSLLVGSKHGVGRVKNLNFVYGIGPFLGIGSGGGDGDISSYDYDDGSMQLSKLDIDKFNVGLSAMVGFEYKVISFSVIYDYGFTNLAKSGAMRTSGFRAELGLILPLGLDY